MKRIFLSLMVMGLGMVAIAQNVKRPESYNYMRGVEAMQEKKVDEALDYFNKDLKENPKNGYSFSWIAMLRNSKEEYGKALDAGNLALKYLPKKDVEYVTFAYSNRAKTYLCLEDTVKALADYTAAVRLMPKETKPYEERAQIYYEQGKYDLADADYKKMIELKPGDIMGYMGLGRNANAQKHWADAIKQFDYVSKLAKDYSQPYSFRAESYMGLEKYHEATDDIIKALSIDGDRKAMFLAMSLKEPAFTTMVAKLKVQSVKSPNEGLWPFVIALMYENDKQYGKAIEYFENANKRDVKSSIYYRIGLCYKKIGDFEKALNSISQALNMDSTKIEYLVEKADVLYEKGDAKGAVAEWDRVMQKQPEYGFGYYRRGWFKELSGDLEGGLEDLSMAIVLEPNESFIYSTRGDLYLKLGKKDLAVADFNKVIELENTPEKYDYIHYAYQGLGQYDKAKEAMNIIIARDTTSYGNYYDAACLYSRMKDKDNALKHLEKALELGYNRFAHIERDYDLDFLRNSDEFKMLIEKYNSKDKADKGDVAIGVFEVRGPEQVTEIPFKKEDGVCKVKCNINGLPLHFIFDTGASDVTISMVEATFMMKNDYLSGADVIGSEHYIDANGDVSLGTVINLKKVNFGGLELNNVRASVVRNQKAPLLLGQSVLGRLGRIEIDNAKSIIKITHM